MVQTLHQMLRDAAQRAPEQVLLVHRNTATTYGEVDQASGAVAGALRELGVRRGDRVVLCLDNGPEYVVAYYAILKAGAAVVPVVSDTRQATLLRALRHADAAAVILGAKHALLLAGHLGDLPELRVVVTVGASKLEGQAAVAVRELDVLRGHNATRVGDELAASDLASLMYTSGTTAQPKGVMLSHRNLVANTLSIVEYLELSADERVGLVLPFFYSYGTSVLLSHVCVGGTIVSLGSVAFPAAVLKGMEQHRCTSLPGVPSTFARLIHTPVLSQVDLSSVRYLTQAGGPMTVALTEKLKAAFPKVRIYVMYGQTEAAPRLSYLPPAALERKIGSVGIAIPGVELRVLDETGQEVGPGEVGELVARGENIMLGYYKNPDETARALRPEGLRTGDLARRDEDGFFFIVGRNSDMIKAGAHRISPKEIEEVIEKLPEVAQCGVVGVPDELLGEAIAAFVVAAPGAVLDEKMVLRTCYEHLPRFKMPALVKIVEALPRTDTGKLRRSALRDLVGDAPLLASE